MKKFLIPLLFILLFCFPLVGSAQGDTPLKQQDMGDEVMLVQTRLGDLGYLNYRPTGKFSDMTANAVRAFQLQNGIEADGQVGLDTYAALFSPNAVRAPRNPQIQNVSGPSYSGAVKTYGELSAWETINELIPVDSTFTVQDFNSGTTFEMKRVGGENCVHAATISVADYDAFLKSFGGSATWEHRAVLVSIGGQQYAASLFGMPTGGADISGSGMPGYVTLYFNNSKTDVMGLADEEHILSIITASGK